VDVVVDMGNLFIDDIGSQISKILERLPAPSEWAGEKEWSKWKAMSPADPKLHLLYTHRPPGPLGGRQHVTMYSKALGQLYDDIRGRNGHFEISADDMKKAEDLCEISAGVYKDESVRSQHLKPFFKEFFKGEGLSFQESIGSTNSHNVTASDSGVDCAVAVAGGATPVVLEFEYKNGVLSDAMMQAVASYLINHKDPELLKRTCPSILVCILGPHALLFCAVFTGKHFIVDPLTTLSLFITPNDSDLVTDVARVLAATKKAAIAIAKEYLDGNCHQQGFPYKVSCNAITNEQIKFKYTDLLEGENKDKVFTAEEDGGEMVGWFSLSHQTVRHKTEPFLSFFFLFFFILFFLSAPAEKTGRQVQPDLLQGTPRAVGQL